MVPLSRTTAAKRSMGKRKKFSATRQTTLPASAAAATISRPWASREHQAVSTWLWMPWRDRYTEIEWCEGIGVTTTAASIARLRTSWRMSWKASTPGPRRHRVGVLGHRIAHGHELQPGL